MERIESLDEIVERYCVSSNPVLRRLYFGLGLLFIGFAIIGIWVPGLNANFLHQEKVGRKLVESR